jgi:hypothetical protein
MRSLALPTLTLVALAACQPAASELVPDFSLTDVNPASARAGQAVGPRDYAGKVTGWYFGHSS